MRDIFRLLAVAAAAIAFGGAPDVALAQGSAAAGPSFDCARASSGVERMICADPELRALDRGLALFYDAARRNPRSGRPLREQRQWLATRNACATRDCLRDEMMDRLWNLTLVVGGGIPEYRNEDANAHLNIVDLGGGWYAFGAEGIWEGPTINDAGASGAFRLNAGRGEVRPSANANCGFTLTRLPRDRWRIVAHPPADGSSCGGMNATVEGTYRRGRR